MIIPFLQKVNNNLILISAMPRYFAYNHLPCQKDLICKKGEHFVKEPSHFSIPLGDKTQYKILSVLARRNL